MKDFHRDFHGNLDEPIITWNSLQLDAARQDMLLTEFEKSQIEMHHTLDDPYL